MNKCQQSVYHSAGGGGGEEEDELFDEGSFRHITVLNDWNSCVTHWTHTVRRLQREEEETAHEYFIHTVDTTADVCNILCLWIHYKHDYHHIYLYTSKATSNISSVSAPTLLSQHLPRLTVEKWKDFQIVSQPITQYFCWLTVPPHLHLWLQPSLPRLVPLLLALLLLLVLDIPASRPPAAVCVCKVRGSLVE